MKLLLDNEYKEVGFWSFLKCHILTQLGLLGLIYGGITVLSMIIGFSLA